MTLVDENCVLDSKPAVRPLTTRQLIDRRIGSIKDRCARACYHYYKLQTRCLRAAARLNAVTACHIGMMWQRKMSNHPWQTMNW